MLCSFSCRVLLWWQWCHAENLLYTAIVIPVFSRQARVDWLVHWLINWLIHGRIDWVIWLLEDVVADDDRKHYCDNYVVVVDDHGVDVVVAIVGRVSFVAALCVPAKDASFLVRMLTLQIKWARKIMHCNKPTVVITSKKTAFKNLPLKLPLLLPGDEWFTAFSYHMDRLQGSILLDFLKSTSWLESWGP